MTMTLDQCDLSSPLPSRRKLRIWPSGAFCEKDKFFGQSWFTFGLSIRATREESDSNTVRQGQVWGHPHWIASSSDLLAALEHLCCPDPRLAPQIRLESGSLQRTPK